MSRRPANFTQANIRKAVRAVQLAGCQVARVDISEDGRIQVLTTAGAGLTGLSEGQRLEQELADFRRGNGYS